MKARRLVFFLLMPVFLLAGLYTGLRIWYLLLLTQVLLLLAILALNLWTVRTFAYTQTLEEPTVVKGGETVLRLSLRNEKPFPLSMMRMRVALAGPGEERQIAFSLLPFSGREFSFPVSAPYRGVYPLGITTLEITDIFGLLPMAFDMRRFPFYRQPELTVLPRAQAPAYAREDVADEKLFGDRYLLASSEGSGISGARAYRPGDPLRQLHWKKSAQRGELFVRQYEQPAREDLTLLMDNGLHGAEGETALALADTLCEAAACFALHCLKRGRSAVLLALGDTGGVRAGEEALEAEDLPRLLDWLARLPFGTAVPDRPFPLEYAREGSALMVLTGRVSPELEAQLVQVAPYFSAVTLVLAGEEGETEGTLPRISLPLGCDVAAELAARA